MRPEHLLDIADDLARGSGRLGRPRQADLARAVSTAYYAVFHALANCCADRLAGASPSSGSRRAWRQTYTALEHRFARNRCENRDVIRRFPEDIQAFAASFALLQRQREVADYEPNADHSRHRVEDLAEEARQAVQLLESADARDRRAFALYVLLRLRSR